jgi:serine/threonine-protein kinase
MSPQESIAHYRIAAKLGEGGMGAVYRATDTKLNREVAIKILPEVFAADPDRMARFTREAQVLASLNHPNIAAIYGVEDRAIILELVEGPTLAQRIARGAIPLDEALAVGKQIAEALEYAHERGVVHRDLKPANVKITPDGRVKVLDFGLAAVAQAAACEPGDLTTSPTLTMRTTVAGTLLGTAGYMSPEQARGQAVDRRADIWAFGVVLHEMLTGRALFGGSTISDTLAGVLKGDLDLTGVPSEVRPVVERCLRRDLRLRWRSIGDVFAVLEEGAPVAAPLETRRNTTPWIIAAALAIALAVTGAGWWRATRPVEHLLMRLSVDLGVEALTGLNLTAAISPDGRRLVYPARGPDGKQQLATRLLDQAQATFLPGTEAGREPFFSPDGQSIGFYALSQLKIIPVQGGAPISLSAANGFQGGNWGDDGSIVFSPGSTLPLSRISAAGGKSQPITRLGPGEITHRWPQFLPGGGAVLFTSSPSATGMDNASLQVVSLKTGQVKILQRGGYYGRYLPGGWLVYLHQGGLYGAKFDLGRLEMIGSPTSLLEDVAASPSTGGGQFDFSASGAFVYLAGRSTAQAWQVAALDSSGKMQTLMPKAGAYSYPVFSPDGRKLAFIGESTDVYIYELGRDTTARLTFKGDCHSPAWAPDSRHVMFASGSSFMWMRGDGVGDPQRLLEDPGVVPRPWSFAPDGRRLAYHVRNPETGFDLWTLPLDLTDPDHPKAGKPELFLRTPDDELVPRFSPDGRWIAYRSSEGGHPEVYVRPFPPASGSKWQISSGGGLYPLWSNNGRELFYETADNRIMVVDYTAGGASFVPGKPRLWLDKQLFYTGTSNLDLAPDGKHFAVLSLPESALGEKRSVHVTMLLNFFDELTRRLP